MSVGVSVGVGVKEYLSQLHRLDVIINHKMLEKAELRNSLTSIGGPNLSGERVSSSKSAGDARYVNKVIKLVSIEEEIDRDMEEYIDLRHTIINQLHNLNDVNNIKLLYKRYIENKKLDVISAEMNYSYDYVRELHGRALHEFETTHTTPH